MKAAKGLAAAVVLLMTPVVAARLLEASAAVVMPKELVRPSYTSPFPLPLPPFHLLLAACSPTMQAPGGRPLLAGPSVS